MEIIGKVKIKWNDAPVSVPVTADGYIQMPDGTMRRLREETFQGIKEKLLTTTPAQQTESESEGPAEPTEVAEPAGPTEPETSPAVSEPVSEAPVASAQDTAEELVFSPSFLCFLLGAVSIQASFLEQLTAQDSIVG